MSLAEKEPVSGPDVTLSRDLGVGAIVFMVVAAAAPLGVVAATFPIVIGLEGSVGAPLYFVLVTILLTLFSVGYTLMSRYVPNAGAFYSYIQAGFGRVFGTGAATLALLSYFVLLIGITAYFGVSASNLVRTDLHIDLPWSFWMFAGFVIAGYLGYHNVDLSAKVLGVALILESLIVTIMDVAIIAKGGHHGLSASPLSFGHFGEGAPGLGLMFAFFCFFGFEATAVFRNEAKDPARTVPRATYIAVISIGVFYAISVWCVVMGLGVDRAVAQSNANPEGVVLNLAGSYVAPIMHDIMLILLVSSQFACTLSFHNVVTRYQYTMGTKGVLPRWISAVSPKHLTPSRSSLVLSVLCLVSTVIVVVLRLDPITQVYTWLSGAATLGIILMMALTGLAVMAYFHKNDVEHSRWHTLIAPAVSSAGLFAVLVLVIKYFNMLVGGKTSAAIAIIAVVALSFVVGLVIAARMRVSRPGDYERLMDAPEVLAP